MNRRCAIECFQWKKNFAFNFRTFSSTLDGKILQKYRNLIGEKKIEEDKHQIQAISHFDNLLSRMKENTSQNGIYIYGSVGTGKTMIMDLFFTESNLQKKKRIHFDDFLREIQNQIWQQVRKSKGNESTSIIAKNLLEQYQLLCLDEFQMPDIASATMISKVIGELLDRGITLVATSNLSPSEVCTKGLHFQRFTPFAQKLEEKLQTIKIGTEKDYRALKSRQNTVGVDKIGSFETYFTPVMDTTTREMEKLFSELSKGDFQENYNLTFPNERVINIRRLNAQNKIAMFRFDDIFTGNSPLGLQEISFIAESFDIIFLSHIPIFDNSRMNEARRFIHFIDQIYNRRVKLVCSASAPIPNLFQIQRLSEEELQKQLELAKDDLNMKVKSKENSEVWWNDLQQTKGLNMNDLLKSGKSEQFAVSRTISRLYEMNSRSYWLL